MMGYPAFHYANSYQGTLAKSICKLLLEHGADPTVPDTSQNDNVDDDVSTLE